MRLTWVIAVAVALLVVPMPGADQTEPATNAISARVPESGHPSTPPPADTAAKVYVCPMPDHPQEFAKPGSCPICGMDLVEKGKQLRVAVLVFDNVEEIDYTAPIEVFGQAGARVFTVSPSTAIVRSVFGLRVQPEFDLEHAPPSDVVLIPGGGVGDMMKDEKVLEWLRQRAASSRYVLSVCNGAFIVARAGLLDGLSATTTAGRLDELAAFAPKTHVVRQRVVDNGKVITVGGLSSGIDGALHVVEREYGRLRAEEVARGIEYRWQPEGKWSRAAYADLALPHIEGPEGAPWEKLVNRGDTRQWEVRGRHTTTLSPEEIVAPWVKQIVEQGWTAGSVVARHPSSAARDKVKRSFTKVDRDGRAWAMTLIAEKGNAPSTVMETVTIGRVDKVNKLAVK
jgi:putative intracellular protease/amidase